MRTRYIDVNGHWLPVNEAAFHVEQCALVMPDIKPFDSPDGAHISGRRQWREHLKATDSIEMGHADIASAQKNWNARRAAWADKLKGAPDAVSVPVDARPIERSRLNVEVANCLHNRPAPERKELIKLSLDLSKRMNRGR